MAMGDPKAAPDKPPVSPTPPPAARRKTSSGKAGGSGDEIEQSSMPSTTIDAHRGTKNFVDLFPGPSPRLAGKREEGELVLPISRSSFSSCPLIVTVSKLINNPPGRARSDRAASPLPVSSSALFVCRPGVSRRQQGQQLPLPPSSSPPSTPQLASRCHPRSIWDGKSSFLPGKPSNEKLPPPLLYFVAGRGPETGSPRPSISISSTPSPGTT